MGEPKPFASLSSGLLARKGAAKPAMRPQGFGQIGAAGLEDLGWNDMGYAPPSPAAPDAVDHHLPQHVPSSIAALTPAPRPGDDEESEALEAEWDEGEEEEVASPPPSSPVVEQQRAIAASFTPPAPSAPIESPEPETPEPDTQVRQAPVVVERKVKVQALPAPAEATVRPAARGAKAKAAFTLRLDPERHLRLRLACAVTHRSAQQIVSDALDDYLRSLPELDAMAEAMPAKHG